MNLFNIASDIFEEKMKAALSTYFHGKMDKKKVKEIFNDLYVRQEGQALFENQGLAEGIDFYVLSDKLRADIIENVLSYYKEIIVKTWEKQPFSDRIVTFLSEWMPETDADNMFQSLRNQQIPDDNYIFFNLMRVIRKIKKDNLSNMDFSNMDLRTVQLNGARLVNGKCCANFRNAKINYGTLIMQGHHDKIYYIAFSEDGRQMISASAFEIRIWDISTGSCIHEITQGIQQLNGDFKYNQPKYYRKFITADGNEFVWVGENDICAGMFIECFATLFSCDNGWKDEIELFKKESSFGWKKARKKQLEIILKYRINTGNIVIQEDRLIYATLSSDEFNFAHKKAGTLSNLCFPN